MFISRRAIAALVLAVSLGPVVPTAGAASLTSATLVTPNQSLLEVKTSTSWNLANLSNFAITGAQGSWAAASVMTRPLTVDSFVTQSVPSRHWVDSKTYCAFSACSAVADYVDQVGLRTMRPGTYYVVVVGPPEQSTRVKLGGFRGTVRRLGRLPTGSTVKTFTGVGAVASRQVVLDGAYPIEPSETHTLGGFMYLASFKGPGSENLVECAGRRAPVVQLEGRLACTGFTFIYGGQTSTSAGLTLGGWSSLGNVNPASGGRGDGQFNAVATAEESQLVVMLWNVVLPF